MQVRWVVKLGGSLALSSSLKPWLQALSRAGIVLVPGGGPFAEVVRAMQPATRFDDSTAHAMALLAMAQYGLMLKGLCPRFTAQGLTALASHSPASPPSLWLPDLTLLEHPDIAHSWQVTSDSLSVWLAARLGIQNLLLIKSARWSHHSIHLTAAMDAGLVDTAFGDYRARHPNLAVWLCHQEDHPHLARGLTHPEEVFTRLT